MIFVLSIENDRKLVVYQTQHNLLYRHRDSAKMNTNHKYTHKHIS